MTRFTSRYVTVIETAQVVGETKFSYRSYDCRGDAYAAADRVNKGRSVFRRAYVVDTKNMGDVILP